MFVVNVMLWMKLLPSLELIDIGNKFSENGYLAERRESWILRDLGSGALGLGFNL